MVVCESVPTTVSGYARVTPRCSRAKTTRARYSRLIWWTMPVPGGTTLKFRNAFCPQRRNAYRSRLRSNSIALLRASASGDANRSTCTE